MKKCFEEGTIPSLDHESYGGDPDVYCPIGLGKPQWLIMKTHIPTNQRSTFQGIPVTLTGQLENRHMRRYLKKKTQEITNTIDQEVKHAMKEIAKSYIQPLIKYVNGYFIDGDNPSRIDTKTPEWISLAKNAFDFSSKSQEDRTKSFMKLMSTTMIQPYTEKEVEVGTFQYKMLLRRAESIIEEDKKTFPKPKPLNHHL